MQMLARCPACGQVLRLTLSAADKRITCPECGRLFKVPPLENLKKAMDVVKDARSTVYVDEDGNTYA